MTKLFARRAFLPEGWASDVRIEIAADGRMENVVPAAEPRPGDTDLGSRLLLPAPANVHSHAFQRGMAGLTEYRSAGKDNFWSWRNLMYRFVDALTPEQIEAISAQAFVEMLEAGYAAVGEFHYLHHQPDGEPYADPAELSRRIFNAARSTGIGLTHLPVLYSYGGPGKAPLKGGQLRFGNHFDRFAALVENAETAMSDLGTDCVLGIAPHSLRAVTPDLLNEASHFRPAAPIHIHAAEQIAEVKDVKAWIGSRPIEFLLDEIGIDRRWCVVHATQMNAAETAGLAGSGAVAGLCPVTEANLGDGIFNCRSFYQAGGRFGIGTDSNIRISLADELRQLEYSQRLKHRIRNVVSLGGSVGEAMYRSALESGAQALGRPAGAIRKGVFADLVAIDGNDSAFAGLADRHLLDGWIFVARDRVVTDLWSAGRHCVSNGRHVARDSVKKAYRKAMAELLEAI